ncbi:UPF0158 family protein [Paenibacillus xylanexedens]|uniref:UPF0158 family protein n=1 Tax=Paenibacillus xylanexedens TaxID=528191 RepID=UPI0011A62E7B|nr:UPF0158 family protein [Paenibacillus xylanexedens]
MKVMLQEVIDHIEMDFEGTNAYVNLKTGELVSISEDDLRNAEDMDEQEISKLPDWRQVSLEIAIQFIENENQYEALPTKEDFDAYGMMERFISTLNNDKQSAVLDDAIRGKGAFRRFKDKADDLGLLEAWYRFENECYKEIAVEWCETNGITYEE